MGDLNFNRRYLMKAGQMGREGFTIGQTSASNPHALHISFSIEKSTSETSNTAKVQVWNLSPASLSVLDMDDCIVELQAGYEDHISLILVGNVVTAETQEDGADRLTEIEVVDGRVALRDTFVTLSYTGPVNTKALIDFVANAMGVPVIYSPLAPQAFVNLPNGFAFVGAAKDALKKVCESCGLKWSMQNQILQVHLPNEPITTRAYVLSPDTGLLGIPKRITLSLENGEKKEGESAKNQIGYEVRFFLNGAIGINDFVHLESKAVRGDFRVYKLTIDGDNLEGEWTCTAQLLEVK